MGGAQEESRIRPGHSTHLRDTEGEGSTHFGDYIQLKQEHTLCIGFQNIGGIPAKKNRIKDDIIRCGIEKFDFDIFGLAEVNTNWTYVQESDRLVHRSKHWWGGHHFTSAHNIHSTSRRTHQYGGVAMWSIGKASHRVIGQGRDPSGLGRWVWTRYRGRNNVTLRIFTAYRPNPPSEGPFTVHAQHRSYFNSIEEDRCPRKAFLEDICKDVSIAQGEGDNTIVMLNGNEDMRTGDLFEAFSNCNLQEAIIHRHGTNTPSTYIRNLSNTPINGIWCNPSLTIQAGGYCEFNQVFANTNH
jgi:hypothetical protein